MTFQKFSLVFFDYQDEVAPLANDSIMSWRSIWSFRHLECQNPSIISEDIGRARMVQQFWNGGTEEEGKNGGRTEYSCLR